MLGSVWNQHKNIYIRTCVVTSHVSQSMERLITIYKQNYLRKIISMVSLKIEILWNWLRNQYPSDMQSMPSEGILTSLLKKYHQTQRTTLKSKEIYCKNYCFSRNMNIPVVFSNFFEKFYMHFNEHLNLIKWVKLNKAFFSINLFCFYICRNQLLRNTKVWATFIKWTFWMKFTHT